MIMGAYFEKQHVCDRYLEVAEVRSFFTVSNSGKLKKNDVFLHDTKVLLAVFFSYSF